MPYFPRRTVLQPRGRLRGWARQRQYLRSYYGRGLGQDPDIMDLPIDSSGITTSLDNVIPVSEASDMSFPLTSEGITIPLDNTQPFSELLGPTDSIFSSGNTPSPSSTPAAIAKLNSVVNAATSPYGSAYAPVATIGTTGISQNVVWLGFGAVALLLVMSGGKKKRR